MKMRKCAFCREYTLRETCPLCGRDTTVVYPPKFSPEDKYGKYRRKLKKEILLRHKGG